MDIYIIFDNRFAYPHAYAFKHKKTAKRYRDRAEIKGRGTGIRRLYVDPCPTDGMYTKNSHYCAECNGGE
jgi:hypothetical protein